MSALDILCVLIVRACMSVGEAWACMGTGEVARMCAELKDLRARFGDDDDATAWVMGRLAVADDAEDAYLLPEEREMIVTAVFAHAEYEEEKGA